MVYLPEERGRCVTARSVIWGAAPDQDWRRPANISEGMSDCMWTLWLAQFNCERYGDVVIQFMGHIVGRNRLADSKRLFACLLTLARETAPLDDGSRCCSDF